MKSIKAVNISKSYRKGEFAVSDVNFNAAPGEFVVLVGPSGCGKSTLLKMIAGLEEITSGELFFDEQKMNDVEPKNRNIGMVFQNYALYPHLTVSENLAFPLKIKKIPADEIKNKVTAAAEMLGLKEYLDKKPRELSGGQRQRVALGRAIIRKPDIFLFDEPLSNLDAKLRVKMRTEIVSLHRKAETTSIYVTHDQTEAMTMADRIIVMNAGKIMQTGSPIDIYDNPQNLFTATFIGSPQINLFDGIIDNGKFIFKNSKCVINIPKEKLSTNSAFNGEATLAVRPEYISLDTPEKSHENSLISRIANIEFLGHEQLVYFDFDGLKTIRTTPENSSFNIGASVEVTIDPARILLFDKSGTRI